MTPQEILDMESFSSKPILPEIFPTVESVLARRGSIKHLDLLPIKTDEMRAHYNSLDKDKLAADVLIQLGSSRMFCQENKFPYLLPKELVQLIVWVKNRNEPREEVAKFILQVVEARGFKLSNLILFERPQLEHGRLVKGTLPQIRHVHLWSIHEQ
jgi:hypothetical protein